MSGQASVGAADEGVFLPSTPSVKLVWPKKSLSVRIRQDLRAALDLVTEIKRRRNKAHGLDTKGIDFTGTLEGYIEDGVKADLAQYGLGEDDFCRSDDPDEREKHAKAVVERIAHLIDEEAKK